MRWLKAVLAAALLAFASAVPTLADGDLYLPPPLRTVVDIRNYGAVPDDSADDTAAINRAIAYIENSGTAPMRGILYFPPGTWNVNAGFTLTKGYGILGAGQNATTIAVAASVGASTDIFTYTPSNCFPEGSGFSFRGIRVTAASGTPARHAIMLDVATAGRCLRAFEIENNWLGPLGGTAIAINNPIPNIPGVFDGSIRRNYINGGIALINAADSINIENNVITGANIGVDADLVTGAANLRIVANNCTSDAGCVRVIHGVHTIISENYMEKLSAWSGGSGNKAMIELAGSAGAAATKTEISKNQISILTGFGGAGVRGIYSDYGADTDVSNNNLYLVDASTNGIETTANTLRTRFRDSNSLATGSSGTLRAAIASSPLEYLDNALGLNANERYLSGRTYVMGEAQVTTATIGAVDTIYLYPFRVLHTIKSSAGQVRVSTGGAGSSVKAAIWANSAVSDRPLGAPLCVDNTGVTTQTGTDKTPALACTLPPGLYWAGTKYTGTLPIMYVFAGSGVGWLTGLVGSAIALSGGISFADAYANSMPTFSEGASFTGCASCATVVGLTTQ